MDSRHTMARALPALLVLAGGCFSTNTAEREDPEQDGGPPAVDAGPPATDAGPSTCRPTPVDVVRHTATVVEGDPATITLLSTEVSGCSCTPGLVASDGRDGVHLGLQVCDCCEPCLCIDPGYEGTASWGLDAGDHRFWVPDARGFVDVAVVPGRLCFDGVAVTGVEVEPRGGWIPEGPRAHWVRVTGTIETCCPDDPKVALRAAPTGGFDHALEALHCDRCPIDCFVPETAPFEAWAPLLEVPAGEHVVTVGDVAATFEVERY